MKLFNCVRKHTVMTVCTYYNCHITIVRISLKQTGNPCMQSAMFVGKITICLDLGKKIAGSRIY